MVLVVAHRRTSCSNLKQCTWVQMGVGSTIARSRFLHPGEIGEVEVVGEMKGAQGILLMTGVMEVEVQDGPMVAVMLVSHVRRKADMIHGGTPGVMEDGQIKQQTVTGGEMVVGSINPRGMHEMLAVGMSKIVEGGGQQGEEMEGGDHRVQEDGESQSRPSRNPSPSQSVTSTSRRRRCNRQIVGGAGWQVGMVSGMVGRGRDGMTMSMAQYPKRMKKMKTSTKTIGMI